MRVDWTPLQVLVHLSHDEARELADDETLGSDDASELVSRLTAGLTDAVSEMDEVDEDDELDEEDDETESLGERLHPLDDLDQD